MTNKTAATRYARALLDVAVKEKADLEQIEVDLSQFVALFTEHPPLAKVLLNPAVPVPRKRAAVVELLTHAKMSTILSKLIVLLAERDRLVLLPDTLESYRDRLLDHQHVVRAVVTTAVEIDKGRTEAIQRGLATLTGRTVRLSMQVDASIIGGVVARIGSTVYDASVTRQLAKLKESLENA